jgi:hypothetical protein
MAGRKQLVEVNANVALGETSAALIGPGLAGGPIHMLTAPFAIALDAITFFVSALMLRRIVARNDVPNPSAGAGIWIEIGEGLKLVRENRTLGGLAWLAGTWQFLTSHADRRADPVRDPRDRVVGRRDRRCLRVWRPELRAGFDFGAALVSALRYRSGESPRPHSEHIWGQAFRLIDRPRWQQLAIASRVIQRVTCANTLDLCRRLIQHRFSYLCAGVILLGLGLRWIRGLVHVAVIGRNLLWRAGPKGGLAPHRITSARGLVGHVRTCAEQTDGTRNQRDF